MSTITRWKENSRHWHQSFFLCNLRFTEPGRRSALSSSCNCFNYYYRQVKNKSLIGERFLLNTDRENGVIVFAADIGWEILASCDIFIYVGTF